MCIYKQTKLLKWQKLKSCKTKPTCHNSWPVVVIKWLNIYIHFSPSWNRTCCNLVWSSFILSAKATRLKRQLCSKKKRLKRQLRILAPIIYLFILALKAIALAQGRAWIWAFFILSNLCHELFDICVIYIFRAIID